MEAMDVGKTFGKLAERYYVQRPEPTDYVCYGTHWKASQDLLGSIKLQLRSKLTRLSLLP